MNELDKKINACFPGLVVRKDLVKIVKGNAIVPTYVLEYLLGQYCASDDEATIAAGISSVQDILQKHYVHRNEAGLIRSTIREKHRHKVIDKISVDLNEKSDCYEATFSNLGIKKVRIDSDTVKKHPKLLVGGVWCIAEVEYDYAEDKNTSPWILATLKPIQMSNFNLEEYLAARAKFTLDEWIDLLIQSIGFNPEMFGRRSKLLQLVRLIPYCERNYNLIELGPKGTGKSHIYSEFSPHGILISGSEVSAPKLFVNNSTGKIGLVGYWDAVAFDEFAGKDKRADKAVVDITKNYLAQKSFSRGIETLGADASMVYVGNTKHTVAYMLKHSNLFDELPALWLDSAFLDRLHFYIPGWEVDIIRGEMFSTGYGFVVDYLAEILRAFRTRDYSNRYAGVFELCSDITTRDRDGVLKTFSGLMKILFPNGEATEAEMEELLRFSIEGRKRIKDQLLRIDTTFNKVKFLYGRKGAAMKNVLVLEETEYPQYYNQGAGGHDSQEVSDVVAIEDASSEPESNEPEPGHLVFNENQKGVSFEMILARYLRGAKKIVLTDPYIRMFYQIRNLVEFMELVVRLKPEDEETEVRLVTVKDEFKGEAQEESFAKIKTACAAVGVQFNWEYADATAVHARHIVTDHGWKILLDRGLDIFQHYEMNDTFALNNRLQQFRSCKAFEITYIREDPKPA